MSKVSGPDNIQSCLLKTSANQQVDIITCIFRSKTSVFTCLKKVTIEPSPKMSVMSCLNDYCPVTLTPMLRKCFENMVLKHIKNNIPLGADFLF